MLYKTKSRSTGLWKYGFSAPLFILMLIVSAAAASSESNLLSVDGERTIEPVENITSLTVPEILTGASRSITINDHYANLKKGLADRPEPKTRSFDSSKPDKTIGRENPTRLLESPIQDRTPSFPGGFRAWQEYLANAVKYPALAKNNNVKGMVYVSFTVEKDGSLENIKVTRGIGSGADEEAIRVITQSPKWIPATVDGKPVRVYHTASINFGLNSSAEMSAGRAIPGDVFDFSTLVVLPQFNGGMAGWGKYLTDNLKYPEQARKDSITGRVIMSFIVEKNGTLSDVKVIRGIGGGADEEAIRVVTNSPKWSPGEILDGKVVRVAYTMPIFFKLGAK